MEKRQASRFFCAFLDIIADLLLGSLYNEFEEEIK